MNQRVDYLDFLRGIGCLLMLIAHTTFSPPEGTIAYAVAFTGSMASIFFLTTTAITTTLQVEKYSLKYIIVSNLLLFIFGLAYAHIVHIKVGLYSFFVFEILQLIAIGNIIIALICSKFQINHWVYLFIALAIFGIKLICDNLIPNTGHGILLPALNTHSEHPFQTGNFPIIPWLYQFFIGLFVFHATQRTNLLLAFFNIIAIVLLWFYKPTLLDLNNKWDMSIGYFLYNNVLFFILFYIARATNIKNGFINYMGKRALSVFMGQGLGVLIGLILMQINPYLAWLSAVLITLGVLWLMDKVPPLNLFNQKISWVILALFIVFTPLLTYFNNDALTRSISIALLLISGLVFAIYFPQLNTLVKDNGSTR